MNLELSVNTVNIIKESAQLVTANALSITENLYQIVFSKHPDISTFFDDAPTNQSSLLAEAISAYAVNIDNLMMLTPALEIIAQTHVRRNIQDTHYIIIGMAFIESLEVTLKEQATLEFLNAWREAYIYLSQILILMEKNIRLGETG
ncbi:globin domain-containing protein [Sulfurimonas sp.]|nr:globin domain-containing protein [Sulfurimonas sp.]